MNKIIEFKNVRKEFLNGSIIANDGISFFIKSGEVHALAGENGAGKSTLLSMLFGLYKPTSGDILVNGKKTHYNSALDAIKDGMGMVHQHFQLIEKFTVAENVILGNESYALGPQKVGALKKELKKLQSTKKVSLGTKTKTRITSIKKTLEANKTTFNGFLNRKKINQEINHLSRQYNFNVNATAKIATLNVGQQQKVEILKLLYKKSKILIFDEPTAMLTPQEIEQLLKSILEFKKQGKTIIIITHKLDEIKKVANRVSVLRKGRYIGTKDVAKITANELAKMMVGFDLQTPQLVNNKFGKEILTIDNLTIKKDRINKLDHINFEVRAGEIVAVAGVEGNGQTELAHAISGLNANYQGHIHINKQPLKKLSIKKRNTLLSNIVEDRHKFGVIVELKAYENAVLKRIGSYSTFGFLNRTKMLKDANVIIDRFDVRGANHGNAITGGLSGGNQQKLVIGREIIANRSFILSFQATRGLDIGAINYVHTQLLKQRKQGKAILLISYDLNEILKLADKVIVFNEGKITGVLEGKEIKANAIGKFMTTLRKRD